MDSNIIFKSAKEFGESIKRSQFEFEIIPEDIEQRADAIKRQYGDSFTKFGDFNEINTEFQEVINMRVDEFYSIIPEETKVEFENHFYFSTIKNRKINASIHRSSNLTFFAVFINVSLISLLTKLGKLNYALKNPKCVKFCSRFPNELITKEQIENMRTEMYDYFQEYKMAHGPFLIIDGIEASSHFARLETIERLILFHEIGHFLNGDLFLIEKNQVSDPIFKNIYHQREYLADLVAFGLLIIFEKKNGNLDLEKRLFILFSIIHLFDVMYGINSEETEKHPHPLERLNKIIEYYYGTEIAEIVYKTYFDKNEWNNLTPLKCPTIRTNELAMETLINKSFREVFEKEKWTSIKV